MCVVAYLVIYPGKFSYKIIMCFSEVLSSFVCLMETQLVVVWYNLAFRCTITGHKL